MPFCSPIPPATRNAQRVRCLSLSLHSCDRIPNSAASSPIVLSLIALLLDSTPMAPRRRYLVGRVYSATSGGSHWVGRDKDESCDQAALKPSHLT
ncbi:uncharacterized protein K444DRAFT_14784 [Hyaloscypha bicolor E]|uniref:Uncharacterized protein n=1 Tax=Hyaloscypha bicolor E TaxID=1095630 RepID=A0A2J6TWH0_9HELO|nr:uncharacterized protein K444DRAFT_14784 [Hyaloscypha bicolor E]PMD67384.1 hypothetical protein K444DRAFT_14784 [Hyaloscypha bicolor E]